MLMVCVHLCLICTQVMCVYSCVHRLTRIVRTLVCKQSSSTLHLLAALNLDALVGRALGATPAQDSLGTQSMPRPTISSDSAGGGGTQGNIRERGRVACSDSCSAHSPFPKHASDDYMNLNECPAGFRRFDFVSMFKFSSLPNPGRSRTTAIMVFVAQPPRPWQILDKSDHGQQRD